MKIESLKAGALWHEKLCAEHLGKSSRVETEGNHLIRSNTTVQRLLESKEAKSWSLELYHDAFKNNSTITSKYRKEKLHACIWLLNNKNGFEKKKKKDTNLGDHRYCELVVILSPYKESQKWSFYNHALLKPTGALSLISAETDNV